MKHLLTLCMLALCLCASAKETCPKVIPALQEWKGGSGKLALPAEGSIVIASADEAALKSVADVLAQDLKDLLGWNYTVKTGKPEKNAIYLSLTKPDKQLGEEGYVLAAGRYAGITAPARQGVFWGTRSLLQILYNEKGQLPKGVARDWPQYPNRGFMLDVGRKFFTMDFLRQYVKILSFYKLNEFQIHLNDNGFVQFFDNDWNKTYAAFRLESERFPGLTAKDGSYTKKEFTDLQRLGMEYGVNVIPEIDIPAHSLAFTHYKPEIGSDKYGMDHLDLYKEETYRFVDSLLDEYLSGEEPVFMGPDVHIGTDEYNAKEAEKFRYFTDRYLKYVEKYGKNVRMWGALRWLKGKTPVKADNVTINAWSYDWIDPNASLKDGYKIINTCDTYLYIVPAAGYYRDFLDIRWLYETWRVGKVNSREELPEGTPGLLGGMFAVWNDHCGNGISQQDVHFRTFPAAQVLAEKMWRGKNEAVSFEEFEALCKQMPEAPGINLLGRVQGEVVLPGQKEELSLNGTDSVATSLPEIGYPYAVEFEVNPDQEQNISGILFKGPHSTVYANWENKGNLAFSRDGYTFVFHAAILPAGEWTKVRIEGDYKGTTLYINGEKVERLEGRIKQFYNYTHHRKDRMYVQETLVFPMQQIGDVRNGFKGKLRNINCVRHPSF
ncbi:family 20 glycosylhydrolase [Phocaeicola sartorii]|uniref:Hexosaminidase n=3 Tax=Phocaeicola sartorii TaxID=671267 RepID=R9IKP2_9BACT|nr:family 20 glycosylhydrolase [Phocaeicola sartorii]EOS15148.1 hexosaminidase [Phocaeicola sartorii]MCR1847367.1 family 20 glycosylhydrolase [Phocaeicola sartorii]NBH65512.1 glycoside hydrolase [Phocaeicola sartorii]NUK97578.1 family 20 glycosylhydrolase [Phocaeicola sartorii]